MSNNPNPDKDAVYYYEKVNNMEDYEVLQELADRQATLPSGLGEKIREILYAIYTVEDAQ